MRSMITVLENRVASNDVKINSLKKQNIMLANQVQDAFAWLDKTKYIYLVLMQLSEMGDICYLLFLLLLLLFIFHPPAESI